MAEHHPAIEEAIRLRRENDNLAAELNQTNTDIITVIGENARLQARLDMVNQELRDTNEMTELLLQDQSLKSALRDPSIWDSLMSQDEEWLSLSDEMRSRIKSMLHIREQNDDSHHVMDEPNHTD